MECIKDVVLHWGGKFVRKPEIEYVGGKTDTLCKMDLDLACEWTLLEWYNLFDPGCTCAEFYYKPPNDTIQTGLVKIISDEDITRWIDSYKSKDSVELYAVGTVYALQVVSPKGDVLFKRVTSDAPLSIELYNNGQNGDQCNKSDSGGVCESSGIIATGELVGSSEKEKDYYMKEPRPRSVSMGQLEKQKTTSKEKRKKLTPRKAKQRLFGESCEPEAVGADQLGAAVEHHLGTDVPSNGKVVVDESILDWMQDEVEIQENDDIFRVYVTKSEGEQQDLGTSGQQVLGTGGQQDVGTDGHHDLGTGEAVGGIGAEQLERESEFFEADLNYEPGDVLNEESEFESNVDFKQIANLELKVGQKFANATKFRQALVEWNVRGGYVMDYVKNEGRRITAKCIRGCSWRIHASLVGNETTFMIKTLTGEHTCARQFSNKHANSTYLADKFKDTLRNYPGCSLPGLRNQIRTDMMVDVTMHQVYNMKRKTKEMMEGIDVVQYQRLWDYAEAVRQSNPGSVVRIQNDVPNDNGPITFKRMFLGLGALKEGFLAGCRPVIGLDGCFLKTAFGGQLLSAIGRDGNDNMYPIAFSLVEVESFNSWKWFLDILREHIGESNCGMQWCFITDRQKGLIKAISEVFPNAEHRFCVKHMFENFKKQYKGEALYGLFWKTASVGNPIEFNSALEEMKAVDVGAAAWLERFAPHLWARSHFSTFSKCDVIVNNMNESFNAYILEARDLPIIDMFNWIRRKLMARIKVKKDGMEQYIGTICPSIVKKVQKHIIESRKCLALMASDSEFEVVCGENSFVVDLSTMSCTCRMFDLSGIPCKHAVACIQLKRENVIDYVHRFYSKESYKSTYSYMLHPMPSSEYWSETRMHEILPPQVKRQAGRPKKLRRRGPDEPIKTNPNRASKKGQEAHCRKCLQPGHNVRSCKNDIHPNSSLNQGRPQKAVNKGGRPRIRSAFGSRSIPVEPVQRSSEVDLRHGASQTAAEQVDIDVWAAYGSTQSSQPSSSVPANWNT